MPRALISVFDKTGVVELAKALVDFGWEILSTGGTAKFLREQDIAVTDVAEVTGFPEGLDGRVKTLCPQIHAGILYKRDNRVHLNFLEKHGIQGIDLVVVNLYPFELVAANPDVTRDELVENIDIGGPAMLRAGAKNHKSVTVLCDPTDYTLFLEVGGHATMRLHFQKLMAHKVFQITANYDMAIATNKRLWPTSG